MSQHRYCGRVFSAQELDLIRDLCLRLPTRVAISRALCEAFDWRQPSGRLKDMSARVALLRMQADGLVQLPAPTTVKPPPRWPLRLEPLPMPPPVSTALRELGPLQLRRIHRRYKEQRDNRTWNELVARYHYLGYTPLPGAQLRYFIEAQGQILGLFGIGAAAWKCQPRDDFIGWSPDLRKSNLHLIVGNSRFLILPWVSVKNLASAALGLLARRLPEDWQDAYGYRPALLETFVEADRFKATSYRAANWICVGSTQGRGKLDRQHRAAIPVKHIYLYPFGPNFRRHLGLPRPETTPPHQPVAQP